MPFNSSTSSKAEATAEKAPQRCGPKGYFQGSRKDYLKSHLQEYVASKKGSCHNFWHKLYRGWWERFLWKLNDNEEPPTNNPAQMATLAGVEPGEEAKKEEVEKNLQMHLKNWFINHASAKNTTHIVSTWQQLLQQLHQIRNPRLRCPNISHQFMLDHADKVDEAVAIRCANCLQLSSCEMMNLRYEVTQSLLQSKDPRFVEQLEQRAAAQHEAALKVWSLALEDVATAEDVSQAHDTLFDAVHPLLQAIGSYVGCYISLIAGSPEKDNDEGFFTAVHWWPGDRTSTRDWTQWDTDVFDAGVADQLLQTPPPTLPGVPIVGDTASIHNPPPTYIGSSTTTATRQPGYCPLPTKKTALPTAQGSHKRKHTALSNSVCHFEDSASEEDDPRNFSSDGSGDGSSSGDSLSDDNSAPPKRQRTSRVAICSIAQSSDPAASQQDSSNAPLRAPSAIFSPWVMGHAMVTNSHGSWGVQRCTTLWILHGSWVVQRFSMGHGLYKGIDSPWVMGCTMLLIPHGSWVVQWY
ncbi:hypothetical protein BJ322DRAFT_1025590 [Thelephora terrestris]|uniref:Uncharacterized protein n=1 Tax=Thelephora terrestris TaxID=56493 RepID=A0A9P6L0T8_9AGAM|nr:hypothetical protein BJ322DRAFT_1025590 [Thelephora terrestris]